MTDLLAEISAWSILKWVVIVLVAGFIGQFGKSLAQAVMKRMRLKREEANSRRETAAPPFGPGLPQPPGEAARDVDSPPVKGAPADKSAEKAVKKARKALLKSQKKADKKNL